MCFRKKPGLHFTPVSKRREYEELTENAEKGLIVFLGDSITEIFNVGNYFPGYPVINRGISGNTTDDLLDRIDKDTIPLAPKKLFLMIGTNDMGNHRKPPEYVAKKTAEIIEKLHSSLPDCELFVEAIYPVHDGGWFKHRNSDVIAANRLIKEYCEKRGEKYVDLTPYLIDSEGYLDVKYTADGLHPNHNGFMVVRDALLPYLKQ